MDRLAHLIEVHGLSEDEEHVIIPYTGADGRTKRIFLLRRPFLIVRHGAEQFMTVPLEEVVEALVKNPEGSLWETLGLEERFRLAEREAVRADLPVRDSDAGGYPPAEAPEARGREGSSQDAGSDEVLPSSTRTFPEKG